MEVKRELRLGVEVWMVGWMLGLSIAVLSLLVIHRHHSRSKLEQLVEVGKRHSTIGVTFSSVTRYR